MTFLASLLAPIWRWVAAAGAAIAAIGAVYLKGRSDQKAKAKLEDVTHANEIRRDGAVARASADPSSVHDDGFRRD